MKPVLIATILLGTLGIGNTFASERCNVPMTEWQPRETLQKKLEGDGWKIIRIKEDDGCYEVYGIDEKSHRVEASFDPKTFTIVKMELDH